MDVGRVIQQARSRAHLSQRDLARRAGTSRSCVTEWESGAVSPTVATLTRLLTACGLQIRPVLEPLGLELQEQVDALLSGTPQVPVAALAALATALEEFGVTWAIDGTTALGIHGLAFPSDFPWLVVLDDDALRMWLFKSLARGIDENGFPLRESWFSLTPARMAAVLRSVTWTRFGFATLRPVQQMPPSVMTVLAHPVEEQQEKAPPPDLVVPVLAVHDVESGHPALTEVLAAWRLRVAAPTGG